MKVVSGFAYIGSEIVGHGVQVFNLLRLDSLPYHMRKGPTNERPTCSDVPRLGSDSVIESIGSSHNIVVFQEDEKVLVVGIKNLNWQIIALVGTDIIISAVRQLWSGNPMTVI